MREMGLKDGARVAVVGAGPAGAAFAASLLASSRSIGRQIELTLFDRDLPHAVRAPVLLDPDARCRLASLGAAIPPYLRAVEVRSVVVWSAGVSDQLAPPSGGLWIVDGGPRGEGGGEVLKRSLAMAASLRGARIRQRTVDSVATVSDGLVVRAGGSSETFDLVAGAFGAQSPLAGRWFEDRYRSPGLMLGSHARLSRGLLGRADAETMYVCFSPTPAVDALVVLPCSRGAWAMAVGEDATPQDLAEALMLLARDGLLTGGFEIEAVERTVLHAGGAPRLACGPMLALGGAVQGHPLAPGLLPTLVSAMRTANAVVECPTRRLPRRLLELHADLFASARAQHRLLGWARRAAERVPGELAALARIERARQGPALALFGLPWLHPSTALRAVRRAAFGRSLAALFGGGSRPARPASPPENSLVYVVDDDPDVRGLLLEYLGSLGLTVRGFANESAVLEAAARDRPAAILLDVVLNWVDGLSLCRALRAHPGTAGIRVISMSGLCRDADRQAAFASGAVAFFTKPIDLDELTRCLCAVVPGLRIGFAAAREATAQG